MNLSKSTFIAFVLAISSTVMADVTPADMFMDHMVIQRDTAAPVWGSADVGEQVTVTGSWGESESTTADGDGKWRVDLQTPQAGGPYTLTIEGNNTITINDVLSGEVWLCSGQSNMELDLGWYGITESATDDKLRVFTVPSDVYSPVEELDELKSNGQWLVSNATNNDGFSATAYYYARELRAQLGEDVPVAMIVAATGGTRITPWMPAEAYDHHPVMADYLADALDYFDNWNADNTKVEFDASHTRWKANNPFWTQLVKEDGRKNPSSWKQFPTTKFNSMLHPLIPYAIKGAIWYQGESNKNPDTQYYEGNLRALIESWRARWGQGDFPFYCVQLATSGSQESGSVEYDGWAEVSNQQRRVLDLPNTGLSVSYDIGSGGNIHPNNKVDVGRRLSLWALKHTYGQTVDVWSGPLYKSHTIDDNQVIIEFEAHSVGTGLMVGSKSGTDPTVETVGVALEHFHICGPDRNWKRATATINADNTVTVSHPDISNPKVVRYAWAENAQAANLYNEEGLPAAVFSTEDTKLDGNVLWELSGVGDSPASVDDGTTLITLEDRVSGPDGSDFADGLVSLDTFEVGGTGALGASFALTPNTTSTVINYADNYIEFTIAAPAWHTLYLNSLTFDAARGAESGTVGFEVYGKVDGTPLITDRLLDVNNETGTLSSSTSHSIDLSAAEYHGIRSITFRLYALSADGAIHFNNFSLNGSVALATGNLAPLVYDKVLALTTTDAIAIDLLSDAVDFDGDDIDLTSLEVIQSPENGSLVVNEDRTVTYTANGALLADSFYFRVSDTAGEFSNVGRVKLTGESAPPQNRTLIANFDFESYLVGAQPEGSNGGTETRMYNDGDFSPPTGVTVSDLAI
ncbi:MAG: sialate O-acetylesterase, partial [Rubritalea sp.]|uniref:sialate O-acetylesterase n=1 Tax=Rubritalea sp. TaxID=2109375 RepID=UPI003242E296